MTFSFAIKVKNAICNGNKYSLVEQRAALVVLENVNIRLRIQMENGNHQLNYKRNQFCITKGQK